MCLLVACVGLLPGAPLVVAANRDERLDRPAVAATVLRAGRPRTIGGRDELAGGTWLAVNDRGVVAGLTNCPRPGGRDPAKRSRGQLPLALARHVDARRAAGALAGRIAPADYNPCFVVVGDRQGLWYLDLSGPPPRPVQLPAGLHVLENRPLGACSPKADRVRALLARWASRPGTGAAGPAARTVDELVADLERVLVDHEVPGGDPDGVLPGDWRPAAVSACCVHTPEFGTRSSAVVVVPADRGARPGVKVADGPPCQTPFVDVGELLWADPPAGGATGSRRVGR